MAPKRKRKVVGVVRTTRKVVRETVRVAIVDNDTNDNNNTQPSQISFPDFEGETEDLRESQEPGMGLTGTEEEEALPFDGDIGASTPLSSSTTMSTRRTIIVEDKIPEGAHTKRQVPVEVPAEPKATVGVRTEGRGEMGPESETEGEEAGKDEAQPKVVAQEKPKAETAGEDKKKARQQRGRRKRIEDVGNEEYRRYLIKVLKQVHPGMTISGQAMMVLNAYMNDMFERLADEAARLSRYTGRLTLSSREIQGAVKLVLPGDLGRHAIAEGAKAISNYMSHDASQ